MQSNCTYSDFGTIHVSVMLPFMPEERKWQPHLKVFTPPLHFPIIIKQGVT